MTDIGDFVPVGGKPGQKYIILGVTYLMPFYTMFDIENSRIGFIEAN